MAFVINGFFNEVDFIPVDAASVEWHCFIEDLLSLEEDIVHRDANDFSSIEFSDDCWSAFNLDDFKLSGVVSLYIYIKLSCQMKYF